MQTQLKVIKADGGSEEYMHTKVLAAVSNALASAGQPDIKSAEQLAEVITYMLYHKQKRRSISSGEIFSIIKATLALSGFENAAAAFNDYHLRRQMMRSRIEVAAVDMKEMADAEKFSQSCRRAEKSRWDKSKIIAYLTDRFQIDRQTARVIASTVEQKVLNLELSVVPRSLVKQLVLSEAASFFKASQQMQNI